MPDERLEVSVTFDERGYIGSAPELRQAVVALSLGGLRRKIEIAMLPDDVRVVLQLDGLVERECHRRRAQASLSRIAQLDQRTALPDQCLHRRKRTSLIFSSSSGAVSWKIYLSTPSTRDAGLF